jgi:hypothetical protein
MSCFLKKINISRCCAICRICLPMMNKWQWEELPDLGLAAQLQRS